MRKLTIIVALMASTAASAGEYIGSLSTNRFAADGINNPYSKWNNCYYATSPCNRFGPYGNRFSPYSPNNRFSVQGPRVYGGPYDGSDDVAAEQRRRDDDAEFQRRLSEIDAGISAYQAETDSLNRYADQLEREYQEEHRRLLESLQ